jgi:hypothetical protein
VIGRSRRSSTPATCRALTAGSREKIVESTVNAARRPATSVTGALRVAGHAPRRRTETIQARSSRTTTT